MRHRILLQTDPTIYSTGLSENAKHLLRHLYKSGKYDLAHLWQQGASTIHPELSLLPWRGYGSIPPDPGLIQQINSARFCMKASGARHSGWRNAVE